MSWFDDTDPIQRAFEGLEPAEQEWAMQCRDCGAWYKYLQQPPEKSCFACESTDVLVARYK